MCVQFRTLRTFYLPASYGVGRLTLLRAELGKGEIVHRQRTAKG